LVVISVLSYWLLFVVSNELLK
jgi:hypothetical protein